MAQAISELGTPRVKVVRPTPTFKGRLILGSPGSSDPIISINVERYARTSVARAKTASAFAVRPEAPIVDASAQSSVTMAAEELGNDVGDGSKTTAHLEAVKNSRIYQVDDESAPGGKRQVERDELATGYEYGRTAVFISDSDLNVTKLETEAGLQIIGFVERMKYERHMHMSPANLMIASKSNPQASLALSAFIHALFELDSYGIGRMVSKDGRDPDLVLLAPSIEADYECLLEVQIPFAEDIRPYRFPPLDRIMTVSGKVLTEHRNLPSAQLSQAMSDYVDQMDLSTFGKDDEGNPAEYMALEDTYSPVLHRIDQAVRWRAVYPSQPIPPAYEVLTRYSRAPLELEQSARPGLQKLIAAADLKKVPPKQKGRKKEREVVKPLSGLNVDELLGREKRSQISVDNAVPEFKQQLATAQDARAIEDAFKQMSVIITSLIKHSLGDSGYGRATEGLRVMREELTGLEEPRLYNDFIRDLKTKLLTDKLNGDRREMWWEIRRNRLGLIPKSESDVSDVAEDEAKLFFASR
ncbi:MAG: ATP-dependent DNA helicase II subunit 2 [Phylliscum demangeonii]|nr:MAG: ATP-dependent DNA helicase II subunit 2 [Phylliscum demangeonii]